jgi:uncharacterized ParB-like nuclease family protein
MTKANAITLSNLGGEYQGMWKTCQEKTAREVQNVVVSVSKLSTHSGTYPKSTGTTTCGVDGDTARAYAEVEHVESLTPEKNSRRQYFACDGADFPFLEFARDDLLLAARHGSHAPARQKNFARGSAQRR